MTDRTKQQDDVFFSFNARNLSALQRNQANKKSPSLTGFTNQQHAVHLTQHLNTSGEGTPKKTHGRKKTPHATQWILLQTRWCFLNAQRKRKLIRNTFNRNLIHKPVWFGSNYSDNSKKYTQVLIQRPGTNKATSKECSTIQLEVRVNQVG